MTFSPYISLTKEPRSFKRRFGKKKEKTKLKYGDTVVFFKKSGTVESLYFKFFKKSLKKFIKQSKIAPFSMRKKKIWFFLTPNFPLTKKSKNSRMGKGKGGFVRWAIRVKQNNKLLETRNIPLLFLKILVSKIQFKLNIRLSITTKSKLRIKNTSSLVWYV